MGSIVVANLHVLTLFIWIVSVLTLAVNDDLKTDGRALNTNTANLSLKNPQSPESLVQPEFGGSARTQDRNGTRSSFAAEGGPIIIAPTTQRVTSGLSSNSNTKRTEENRSRQIDYNPIVEAGDETPSKIVPRKGADETTFGIKRMSLNKTTSPDIKPMIESSDNTVHISNEHSVDASSLKSDVTVKHLGDTLNSSANASSHNTNVSQKASANVTTIASSTKKHKPKPTVTIGGRENDPNKPIPASPTKNPPLGMPRKIDYIVPVVITIVALPLLGAATYIVYRQGRDCWDKRHYRRMDFLIDGMYND